METLFGEILYMVRMLL